MSIEEPTTEPKAFYFGRPALVGWLHAPGAKARSAAVVLCPSFGYEELCTHRHLRSLASLLAAFGFWVLRFDYLGTGDSSPTELASEQVSGWLASINTAVGWVREQLHVDEIGLAGLRFGGTLAAVTASQRNDIAAVVMLSAFTSGRSYLRELKALSQLGAQPGTAPSPTPGMALEAAGFSLSTPSLEAVGEIDLGKLRAAPASKVLVMPRDDVPKDDRLVEKLRGLGAAVTLEPFVGYADFVRDTHFAKEPSQAFARVGAWLDAALPPTTAIHPSPTFSTRLRPETLGWAEELVTLGDKSLFGVISAPAHSTGGDGAVVFLNTGANHHIGNHGLSVSLARALARDGLTCLRFDISGTGDSPARPEAQTPGLYSKEACNEVRLAIDALVARGKTRVMLVGLCSGAYLAFHTALADTRVQGLALINAQRFTWAEGDSLEIATRQAFKSTRFYWQALREPETWRRLASGDINARGIATTLLERTTARVKRRGREALTGVLGPAWEKNEVARGFLSLCDRGTQTLLVYSDSDGGLDELEKHLGPGAGRLRGRRQVHLNILEGADHTLSSAVDRKQLETLMREHAQRM